MRFIDSRLVGIKPATALLVFGLLICTTLVQAHEYWLEPVDSTWQVGDTLKADIKNGEEFAGDKFPFNPAVLSGAGLVSPSTRTGLRGRLGDYPAFKMPLQEPGLHLLMLETTRRELIYEDTEAFEKFLEYHALADVIKENEQLSIPKNEVKENYYRFSKALVIVDPSESGADDSAASEPDDLQKETATQSADAANQSAALEAQEQPLEIILADNPLGAKTVRAQIRFEGKPLAARQVELFHRDASKRVSRTTQRSDESGYVDLDIAESGDYLINVVWVVKPEDASADLISLWSSLFFHQ